jgi:hypothetical protein
MLLAAEAIRCSHQRVEAANVPNARAESTSTNGGKNQNPGSCDLCAASTTSCPTAVPVDSSAAALP